jgi:hypothetical protein
MSVDTTNDGTPRVRGAAAVVGIVFVLIAAALLSSIGAKRFR